MKNTTINEALYDLSRITFDLENTYIENDGECTEETEHLECEINAIKELLTTEGVDSLGRWLKAKEDEKKSIKAEKDHLSRRMTAIDNTIDYIKEQVNRIMVATGQEKIKGVCGYSFTPTTSETTEVDKDLVKAIYMDRIQEAMTAAHIPAYINVSLTASATKAKEYGVLDGDEEIFHTTSRPSVRFGKPRAKASE